MRRQKEIMIHHDCHDLSKVSIGISLSVTITILHLKQVNSENPEKYQGQNGYKCFCNHDTIIGHIRETFLLLLIMPTTCALNFDQK